MDGEGRYVVLALICRPPGGEENSRVGVILRSDEDAPSWTRKIGADWSCADLFSTWQAETRRVGGWTQYPCAWRATHAGHVVMDAAIFVRRVAAYK